MVKFDIIGKECINEHCFDTTFDESYEWYSYKKWLSTFALLFATACVMNE